MEEKLPQNWVKTSLGEIAEWSSGGTPKRSVKAYYGGDIPWVKTGDLNDTIVTEVSEYLTEEGIKNSSAKVFPKDSIGIAMYGATIGKTGVFGMDAATNQACAVTIPYFGMNKFLHYFLKSQKQNFIDKGKGGAQPNISQLVIKTHRISLPPLKEQQRIVAKLDTLFTNLDSIKTRLANIPIILKNFRQAVLNQALTGKLTEDWRKEVKCFEYEHKPLKDISKKIQYGYTGKTNIEAIGSQYLRITDIQNRNVDWDKVPYVEIDEKSKKKYLLNKNDIVFARTGATVGKSFLIEEDIENVVFASYLIRVLVSPDLLNPKFLWYYFDSPSYWESISKNSSGIAQPNVNGSVLGSLLIPLPNIEEQTEIVKQVDALFKKADQIQQRYEQLLAQIETLPQAILAKAFKGELVSQLPTDGDAKMLLEEIKKLKEVVIPKRRKSKK